MPKTSRKGYTVTEQGGGTDLLDRPISTTWSVVRDSDGAGLGAYASEEEVDAVIAADRKAE